jgi:hypothetical protein
LNYENKNHIKISSLYLRIIEFFQFDLFLPLKISLENKNKSCQKRLALIFTVVLQAYKIGENAEVKINEST